ncbi:MAG: transcriptional regulator [Thermodesulfobacteriota bacterium]
MVKPKLIKTEADHQAALARIDELMAAEPETHEADELELLSALVEMYEEKHSPIFLPDPIEAIKFRMEQSGLKPADLVPFIGSKSKVSEVLSGKRTLTLSMMRALNVHLGISAEVLLQEPGAKIPKEAEIDWTRFPLKEMANRGWIKKANDIYARAEEIMRGFIIRAGGMDIVVQPVFRRNEGGRKNVKTDHYALTVWCLRVLESAGKESLPAVYVENTVTDGFLRSVAKLSFFSNGPILAQEFLANHGIHLIVVSHLNKTYLDGATMVLSSKTPVIGLTLRYDRIDNFWFTLLHELAHVKDIFSSGVDLYVDDMTLRKKNGHSDDKVEEAADRMAEEALIPSDVWNSHAARHSANEALVKKLARKLEIHPAIIAGRIRYEQNNYRLLTKFVGHGEVRKCFEAQGKID